MKSVLSTMGKLKGVPVHSWASLSSLGNVKGEGNSFQFKVTTNFTILTSKSTSKFIQRTKRPSAGCNCLFDLGEVPKSQ